MSPLIMKMNSFCRQTGIPNTIYATPYPQLKEWEAPMPVVKSTGKAVAMPGLSGN